MTESDEYRIVDDSPKGGVPGPIIPKGLMKQVNVQIGATPEHLVSISFNEGQHTIGVVLTPDQAEMLVNGIKNCINACRTGPRQ